MCSISSARKKAMGGRKQRTNAHPLLSSDPFNVCRSGATTCDLKADAGRCKREGKKGEEGHAQRQTQREREREKRHGEREQRRERERRLSGLREKIILRLYIIPQAAGRDPTPNDPKPPSDGTGGLAAEEYPPDLLRGHDAKGPAGSLQRKIFSGSNFFIAVERGRRGRCG